MFSWVWTPRSLLTWFYDYPGEFVWWINQVFSITENWVSILVSVLFVAMVLFLVFNWSEYNK